MAKKDTKLTVTISAVDRATAVFRAITARVGAMTSGLRAVGSKLKGLASSAIGKIASAFSAVGSVIGSILGKIPVLGAAIAGLAGGAVYGLMKMVDEFDELGDKAEELGVGVDFLAQMRYAAEKSGASVEELDHGLKGFVTSLGQARAGTGRMAAFLKKVSPALYKQVRAAKSNEQAFDLMANAMAKVQDPAKRAALAQKTFGDASLAPLLSRGAAGIQQLRDRYFQLAGSQEEAARKSGEVDDAMKDFKASIQGIKAKLVTAFGPVLKTLIERLGNWISANRERIGQWITDIAEKIPGAIQAAVAWIEKAIARVTELFDKVDSIIQKVGGYKKIWDVFTKGSSAIRDTVIDQSKWAAKAFGGAAEGVTGIGGSGGTETARKSVADFFTTPRLAMAQAQLGGMPKPPPVRSPLAPPVISAPNLQFVAPSLDLSGQAREAIAPAQPAQQSEAKVTIDIKGAPPGTRVTKDPRSTTDLDLRVGYNMLTGGL